MIPDFAILDARNTPLGALILRKRTLPSLDGREIYEVKLGEEFLMSSLFPEAEKQLAHLGLGKLKGGDWDVAVGGLGLGYTAAAALEHPKVKSLTVIELFSQVIEWHRKGLVPLGPSLCGDGRCRLVERDFFAAASDPDRGLDPENLDRRFHAVLLDIDHTPSHQLDGGNAGFYTVEGLSALARHLHAGGVFGLWSDDPPDAAFTALLQEAFSQAEAVVVPFYNPIQDKESANTVYLAVKG